MRRYETIFIIDSELSDEGRSAVFERVKDLIQQHDGLSVKIEEWGSRKLAYEISSKARGYYVRLDFCGKGALVNEIERFFRIDDRILKYMTVLLEKNADLDQLREEIAQAEAARRLAEQAEKEKSQSDQGAEESVEETPEGENVEETPESQPAVEPAVEPETNETEAANGAPETTLPESSTEET